MTSSSHSPAPSPQSRPWLGPLADALAEALPRLYGVQPDPLVRELIVALTGALERGELELSLQGPPPEGVTAAAWPQGHSDALERSGLAQECNAATGALPPLLRTGQGVGWRLWQQQLQTLLAELEQRAQAGLAEQIADDAQQEAVEAAVRRGGLDQQQRQAVQGLLKHRFVLLGGGPGTGKTATVVQMLAAVLSLRPQLRVHLSAPTGKAAARLKQAIDSRSASLPETLAGQLAGLPCTTLHRLLESQGERFGRHRQHPLALDLVVVDEVSMLDLTLASALLEALPEQAQLLLVGDPDQLRPVGPGAILCALDQPEQRRGLGEAAITLTTTYRNQGAIAAVANRLRQGDRQAVLDQLEQLGANDNISWLRCAPPRLPAELKVRMRAQREELGQRARAFSPESPGSAAAGTALLLQLEAFVVLSPLRRGPWGTEELNRLLLEDQGGRGAASWPIGTPVLCTRNQPGEDLANGDVGVVVATATGRAVLFPGLGGNNQQDLRLVHPALLEGAEAAFALTIHKAQGSEYAAVGLVVPRSEVGEWRGLYTGLTRARQEVVLVTPQDPGWLPELLA